MDKIFNHKDSQYKLSGRLNTIGIKIKEERLKRNWEILDVVIRSGISASVIYSLETGKSQNVTLLSLVGLSMAFEVDIISLLQSPPTA